MPSTAIRFVSARTAASSASESMRFSLQSRIGSECTSVLASSEEGPHMPIRLTRIYTRTGDNGETALVGGARVPKDSPRIEAYGTVDELNAIVGLARAFNAKRLGRGKAARWLDGVLRQIQNELFDLGSELAKTEDAGYAVVARVGDDDGTAVEALLAQ